MTPAEFVTLHPEFAATNVQNPDYVQAVLTAADGRVSDSWGDEREQIVGLETAAQIAASPLGRAAQLLSKDGTSTYSRRLDALQVAHACAYSRVV